MPIQGTVSLSSASTLTLTSAASIYVYNGSTAATWTLPAVSGNTGEILILHNRGTATVTVNRAGSDQILQTGGALGTTVPLLAGAALQVINDGAYWLSTVGGMGTLPAFDNTAKTAALSSVPSGTSTTWTQTVAAGGPYGLVLVFSSSATYTPAVAAIVTFGGVALKPLGVWANGNFSGWIWAFGGGNIPSGTQTASVKLTEAGQDFSGVMMSLTYSRVVWASLMQSVAGDASTNTVELNIARSTAQPTAIAVGYLTNNGQPTQSTATVRQFRGDAYAGDLNTFGTDPTNAVFAYNVPGYPNTPSQAAMGIELLTALPTAPYPEAIGAIGSGGGSRSTTWSHTAQAGADVFLFICRTSGTTSATYGGASMTRVSTVNLNNNAGSGVLEIYRIAAVAGGTKTVAVTTAASVICADTISYINVRSVGTPATIYGSGASPSQAASCGSNQLIVQVFGAASGGFSAVPGAATRYTGNAGGLGAGSLPLIVSDSYSALTFTAANGSSADWAGTAVVLG